MLSVYIDSVLENKPYLEILYPNLGPYRRSVSRWGDRIVNSLKSPLVNLIGDPEKADFIMIPHVYSLVRDNSDYVQNYVSLSKKYGKKILVFAYGDYEGEIDIPRSVIFRTSQYRYKKRDNEVMIPAYVDDLSENCEIVWREKKEIPTIGFCGWAGFKDREQEIKSYLKYFLIKFQSYFSRNAYIRCHAKGIIIRMEIIKALNCSESINTDFIIRSNYSANEKTAELDPSRLRSEYVGNMMSSDLALCVKGDGNFSNRFYEALSAGRVPLLVDTNCVLPLENIIKYDDFIVRYDYNLGVEGLEDFVSSSYKNITEHRFIEMQKRGREAFEKYLRFDSFFKYVFLTDFLLKMDR